MKTTDIGLFDGAVSIRHERKYDNLKAQIPDPLNGHGWFAQNIPTAMNRNVFYRAEFADNDMVNFDLEAGKDGIHLAHHDYPDTLKLGSDEKTLIITRKNGVVWTFNNDPGHPTPQGHPLFAEDENGKVTEFVYEKQRLVKVVTYRKSEPSVLLETLEYAYNAEGLLESLTLCRNSNQVLRPFKRVLYTYYVDGEAFGNAKDLKTVTTEIAINDSWRDMGTYYFRYHQGNGTEGPKHCMKMVFFPGDFENFVQNFGSKNCFDVSDEEALKFSTKYYEYDESRRVILERVDKNRKIIRLEYTEFPDTTDENTIHRKTVEYGPTGGKSLIFTNYKGKVLLRENIAPDGVEEPSVIYHYRYNGDGKMTHNMSRGAVIGYSVDADKRQLSVELSPNEGMIEVIEYHDGTQGPKSALARKIIQNGTEGRSILQNEEKYERFEVKGKTEWKTHQRAQFSDEEGKSPIATSYQYEFFPNTGKVMQKTTILPIISKEQNGTGVAATTVERFDEKGRLIWFKDEVGVIQYNQYDQKTGKIIKTIQDVDTARTQDFVVELPKDWATVTDAGKHLVTEYEYDTQGRLIQVLYPENESVDENNNAIVARKASWTVYDEAHRKTMRANGYVTADQKAILVNPVLITIRNVAGKIQEEILAARDKTEGRLLATDKFPQSSYVSWTKYLYEGSNLVATRVYTTIPLTGDGAQGKNYDETVFQYEQFGRQNQTIAPNGLITKQKLDWHGHAVEIWQGADESDLVLMTEMIYGGEGGCPTCAGQGAKPRIVIQHVDDEKIRVTENVYDWRARLVETFSEEDTNGQSISTKNSYDNLGRVVKTEQYVNDALESRLIARNESFYTSQGDVWCQSKSPIDPKTGEIKEPQKSLTWFDAKGRRIKSQQACQCLTNVTTYDSLGRAVRSAVLNKNNKVLQESEQVYDNAGNVVETITTELSATSKKNFSRKQFTAAWFDPMGRSVANAQFGTNGGKAFKREKKIPGTAKGLLTRRVYNAKTGLDAAQIDAAGRTTTFAYDATRRRVKESQFKPESKTVKGKALGHKPVRESKSQVDTLRGVSIQIDSFGNKTQSISDVFGRTIAQIDALGNRTEMTYNRVGELIEQKDPIGRVTQFVYDNLGRRVEVIFPKPNPTEKNPVRKTVYNVLGQIVQEIDPLGHTTTVEYDENGRRSAVVDAEGGRTEFTYDANGKILSLMDPVGNVTSYVYDDAGRMIEETNALGKTRKFEYEGQTPIRKIDRNGRVIEFVYNDFGHPVTEKWFDIEGKLVGTIAYQFDALGKLMQVTDSSGVQIFEYDELDRNTQTVMQFVGLETPVTFNTAFDDMNRRTQAVAKIGDTLDYANSYSYDVLGRVVSISQNEKRVDYTYNAIGQRTSTSVFVGTKKVFDSLYGYDGMGRLNDLTHQNGSVVFSDYDLTWDAGNRITGFDFTFLGDKEPKTAEYGYDQTSQLVEAAYNAFQPNEAYGYDANGNRKIFETGPNNQLTSDNEFRYTYDDEGNRIEKTSISTGETAKYVWDHRNRLVQVIMPKETVAYEYDFQNRMTRRNDEFVVHDGWQIMLALDAKGKVKDRNLWGVNQDELIVTNDQFTLCDHLGSVRDVIDANGKVQNHIEYNTFGKVTKQTGKSNCVFGFTGKFFDTPTGLQWNINRWYDAEVGQWITEDPIGFLANELSHIRYNKNSPLNFLDYYGLAADDICGSCCELIGSPSENASELINGMTGQQQFDVATGSSSMTTYYFNVKVTSKWVSVDNAAIGNCGEAFSASMGLAFGTQTSYELGGTISDAGVGIASISGSVSVGQSQEFTTTINVPEQPAQEGCYYKAYPATIQYDIYRVNISYKKFTCIIPIIWNVVSTGTVPDQHMKTLYKHTAYYLCKCC